MTLKHHTLATKKENNHKHAKGTSVQFYSTDPRLMVPIPSPQFPGHIVAVRTGFRGWTTELAKTAYLLVGVELEAGGLAWEPVRIRSAIRKKDCTGNDWTSESWIICGPDYIWGEQS